MYPLLQGYDSVAIEADVELGGTDQHFNLMVGRHLQRVYGQEPQVVITSPLIEGTDGVNAMSQSRGNYVGITEPPDEMFGKIMSLPDHLMEKYFRLLTDVPDEQIASALALPPHEAKRRLAGEIVRAYHGETAAETARARFDRLFVEHKAPDDVEEVAIPTDCIDGGTVYLPRLLAAISLASSASEGRRLIAQGGVHLGDQAVAAEEVAVEDLRGKILRVGKRRFVRLV
jgi:tyrosyl-tRNA synthetase